MMSRSSKTTARWRSQAPAVGGPGKSCRSRACCLCRRGSLAASRKMTDAHTRRNHILSRGGDQLARRARDRAVMIRICVCAAKGRCCVPARSNAFRVIPWRHAECTATVASTRCSALTPAWKRGLASLRREPGADPPRGAPTDSAGTRAAARAQSVAKKSAGRAACRVWRGRLASAAAVFSPQLPECFRSRAEPTAIIEQGI